MRPRLERHTQIGFRQAYDRDADFLYALHVATMKEYVDRTWGWDDGFQEAIFRKNHNPAEMQIITCDGQDIGMISVEEGGEEVFLRTIAIHPTYQRQGLGTSIIQQIIADAAHQMKSTSLRVLKVNPAKRLYERLGFSIIEETPTHYMMRTQQVKKTTL
jgi:ribosomal protein S18 acetylase RimI-like enzyme